MGPQQDKLFLEFHGLPVIAHTWKRFDDVAQIEHIILVVREEMKTAFQEIAARLQLAKPFQLVAGGKERQDSVWNGLLALPRETEIVLIQDGARPCTSKSVIEGTITVARQHGAAVAAQPMVDTVKESADGLEISRHLDRTKLWAVQTPQTFQKAIIIKALREVREKGLAITDDTAACEYIGQSVKLVASSSPNPKVTVPADIPYIQMLLQRGNHAGQ